MGQQEIYQVLKKNRRWMSGKEIREHCNMSPNSMSNAFVRIKKFSPDIEFKEIKDSRNRNIYVYRVKKSQIH
jgi:hypothetical protein